MEIQDILKWTDEQLLAKTGKHLDSLQKAILEGVWSHQDYKEIALTHQRSYAHVKKEAWKLWTLLSDTIGEDVKKSNVCSLLEKAELSNVSNGATNFLQIGISNSQVNICSEDKRSQSPPETSQTQNQSTIINIIEAPELTSFYDRTSELTTLKQWILEDHTRLITIYGLSGIGKSAIALKLIEEINTQFDYIIWKSLNNIPTLSTLQTELKQFFSQSQQTPLSTVIDYFRNSRCLVILDDLQDIFKPGELAGQYLPEYEDYSKFFKQIATSPHQSCLILLSWTKPIEIANLEAENRPVRTLNLKGLGEEATEIFREKGLIDQENWLELITMYQGHPRWLKIIASTIIELFNGSVSLFLNEQNDIYLGDLEPNLESHLERLSESEKTIIHWLANQDQPVNISQKPANIELSKPQFWQAIQSLIRHNLIEKVEAEGRSLFLLNPIFQHYIKQKIKS
ncbi:NB-ARC domain-containing protein [Planktothrix agardhii]|uniref:NB-ARC domain-containing protein n=1 Tax=Planktothrix agardhii TaxID=1160 RepID=UPI001D0B16F7|nr:NB-ARC domain-containing protein [Planktothrix agardhii]MCB8788447.1 ATPase [Planktothrix agardhii 1025]MCF3612586.1 NB-ARC domain-containing protein [Planktothrix agardhii 1027]MCF3646464.1 NB-ARC domain-containing protein [Planktothrix agardhii 1026]CAD5946433.1 putative WD repeat-containing protein alr2800 [Planktothrix agardhii]